MKIFLLSRFESKFSTSLNAQDAPTRIQTGNHVEETLIKANILDYFEDLFVCFC